MNAAAFAPLDAALTELAGYEPEYGNDLSSHALMVVEALDRLDASARIEPHLVRQRTILRPRSSTRPLAGFWQQVDLAAAAVEAHGPTGATSAWFERIGPGLVGGAFHGTLRVAHALRGLARAPRAPARSTELAHALAYAAAVAAPMPPQRAGGVRDLAAVVAELAPAVALPKPAGLITPQLRAGVADLDQLVASVSAAHLPDDPSAGARALRDQAARIFACASYHPSARFTLLHGVTGMDAVGALVAVLPEDQGARLVRHAAVALAALLVAFGGPLDRPVPSVARSWDALRATAVATGDDHAIKLAAAVHEALAEGAERALYLAALARWLDPPDR